MCPVSICVLGNRVQFCAFFDTDVEPPEIACPPDVDVTVAGWDDVSVTLHDAIGQPSASDNSGKVTWWPVGGVSGNWTFAIGHWPMTYEARDPAGNTANCTQYVHVKGRFGFHFAVKSALNCNRIGYWKSMASL